LPKKSRKPHIVRRTLADGTVKEYRYTRNRSQKRSSEPEIPADTLGTLIRAYRRSPEWGALKPRTRQTYNIYLAPLERLEHGRVADVRRKDIANLRNAIASARGNGAGQGFMWAASALFGWAVEYEWIEHNPAHGIKRLPGGHLRAWTREEADAAQAGLPEHLRRVVVLARYTGQRRGDLCAMGWSSYDGTKIRLIQSAAAPPQQRRRQTAAPPSQ
jgi:integrase